MSKKPSEMSPAERRQAEIDAIAEVDPRGARALHIAGFVPTPRSFYPPDWPACPGCGGPVLDGHKTCGDVACREASDLP
jgi:hypothetical protein